MTVDDLLGVGEIKKQEKKDKIMEEYKYYSQVGDVDAAIELMRSALKEFPNDYTFMYNLQHSLFVSLKKEYADEIYEMGERIIKNCTDDEIRYGAIATICITYSWQNDPEFAKKYAFRLPTYSSTRNDVLNYILEGEELLQNTQHSLQYLLLMIDININCMLKAREYSDDQRLYMYDKIIKFYEILYDDGDFGFYHSRLLEAYMNIALIYAKQKKLKETLKGLAQAAWHAIAYDTMEDHKCKCRLYVAGMWLLTA